MKRVCVFAGSEAGNDPAFAAAARELGTEVAHRGMGLVYGGGSIGLMGTVADAALAAGGEVIGVLPRGLARRELAHPGLAQLRIVASMHERKAIMEELSDGFIALPGGLGTFEELLEILTWAQLGIHRKPIGLLDVADYWAGLRRLLGDATGAGFVPTSHTLLLTIADGAPTLLDRFAAWQAPNFRRVWLKTQDI